MKSGYFGVAIYRPKNTINVGSLLRTAHILGASYFVTIGKRYLRQPSDVQNATTKVPLFEYVTFEEFQANTPRGAELIGVEMSTGAIDLAEFVHPKRACYIFGAEDDGLPPKVLAKCQHVIRLRGESSLNLAVAGSIVVYHREGLRA